MIKDLQVTVGSTLKQWFGKWWCIVWTLFTSLGLDPQVGLERKGTSCHGWVIHTDQDRDGNSGTRHLFSGSTSLSGITAALDNCCVWRSVMLWLSIFAHLTLRDSSCIFNTRPEVIFKTLRSGTPVTQTLDNGNKLVCYWLKTKGRKTRCLIKLEIYDKQWVNTVCIQLMCIYLVTFICSFC